MIIAEGFAAALVQAPRGREERLRLGEIKRAFKGENRGQSGLSRIAPIGYRAWSELDLDAGLQAPARCVPGKQPRRGFEPDRPIGGKTVGRRGGRDARKARGK